MWKKVLIYITTVFIAFGILFASVLRTASVKYEVSDNLPYQDIDLSEADTDEVYIDYYLAYPGRVLPDSPFWSLKALRDKFWLSITTNPTRKAELKLLFADKRLGSSKILFEKGKVEEAVSTLIKAEKYLEDASLEEERLRKEGFDTKELLYRLTNASLKHYQVMKKIISVVPCDVRSYVLELQEYPKKTYERGKNGLLDKGEAPVENPFEW
jgi:hypothetical protein